MLQIKCPWCGERAESEFGYGGEADIERPADSASLSDREWGDYVFMRTNPMGRMRERWVHSHGCRQWFVIERDTVTYKILDDHAASGGGEAK